MKEKCYSQSNPQYIFKYFMKVHTNLTDICKFPKLFSKVLYVQISPDVSRLDLVNQFLRWNRNMRASQFLSFCLLHLTYGKFGNMCASLFRSTSVVAMYDYWECGWSYSVCQTAIMRPTKPCKVTFNASCWLSRRI